MAGTRGAFFKLTTAAVAGAALLAGGPALAAPPPRDAARHPSCDGPVVGCVQAARRTLTRLRDRLGCDHRAPFPVIYVQLERALEAAAAKPGSFDDPDWLAGDLNTGFVGLYLDAYHADRQGRPVPQAWKTAFEAARTGDVNAGQDVLLGANAHIQRDMPYVLAAVGLTRPGGASHKADYRRFQTVLDRAYAPAVQEIARYYDPVLALADDRWNPIAGYTAGRLFRMWREQAWIYAQQLTAATTPAARRTVERRIEANAARWALLLNTVHVPGYRAVRDTYCRTHHRGAPGMRAEPPRPETTAGQATPTTAGLNRSAT
ncbi:hypothetical protein OEIGOIKO_07899 [Streptomyces chrestomyceticus JCM 4735]|uniref:Secreted protein n=1 Tax=Streptomyces chrestomyceticus JCM 4735 TaxID=1306181 RepID=A0A7U9Q103_9ACTN|nr:DUF5995 family protein [Streptomyces chrestomyceticus]GCD40042.1 hypothetical protein OEIGOIKO_07899 [Streptomyces chrestomyceticus JCM 4735]